ncbi:putative kinesin [Leishmania mexicana MHOM/GT/2001/U1103]|uniref:Kinesin n=1 Tax=Leishmania mexicana (strain MHOM/GT/2001/U1103) TaxID=929439 RepID=E9AQX1_LEIMU|nr:putative kinesin [Leishmania mexicana MHOM/GT/2001/U1103]CBZ25342.1 putative kinesin [Leishmania mexicana MHOM/GT/2001/U1103]
MTDGGVCETARVTVSVRVRPKLAHPLTPLQQSERYEQVVCIPSSDKSLRLADCRATKGTRSLHFAYDHVFDMDATQEDVYEAAVLDCVDSVLAGTNASILTYGQTGSGKTFTVLGKTAVVHNSGKGVHAVGADTGLLLRSIQDMLIFAERMRAKCERHVALGMTAIEIYMDEIRDLLREGVGGRPLQPIMTRDVLHLPHLTHVPLRTLQDAFHVYESAAVRRVQRATSANDTSSRSHAFFTIEVFQTPITPAHSSPPTLAECCALREAQCAASIAAERKQKGPQLLRSECFEGAANALLGTRSAPVMYSTLTVADLAGSEKAKHAEVRGTGFNELRHINASLTALGNVVHHLYHGTPHIPYRDSKLTMMLRDTFAAPRAQVALFVNVSPTAVTCEETLSSLYFADKIKSMRVPEPGAKSPQHAALQSAYLESIHIHDALLADAHIFQVQQEHATGLLQLAAALTPRHPLFQLPFHTPLANGTDKTTGMQVLCTRLRERLAHEESPEARVRNFLETRRRELLRDMLRQYGQRRAEVQAQIATVDEAGVDLRAELSRDESAIRQLLRKAEEATAAIMATRQELTKVKNTRLGELQRLRDFEAAANEGDGGAVDAHVADANNEASLAAFEQERATYEKALELAQLRLTLVGLMAPESTPSPSAHADGEPAAGHCRGSTTSRSCRDAASTTASSTPSKPTSIEEWLRGAVLAMTGNAVVQSSRKHPRQQQQQERLQPISLPQPFRIFNFTNSSGDPQPLPKYWSVCHRWEETGRVGADTNARAVAPDATGKGTSSMTRHLSSFDDPALLTRVTAYMDMGASLTKLDRYGRPHTRWFYLSQKANRLRLCWDESHRGPGLTGGGRVYLDSVVKITLGRSSPAFLKYATHERKSEVGDFCTSFTLTCHSHARRQQLKFVDVMCRDRAEVETWVVGLTQLAGVFPCFDGARQPIGVEYGDEEEAAVTGSDAAANADAAAAKEAQRELSDVETVLCRSWHIPAQTMLHTRREIETRRQRHQSGRLRLSPGELRGRTGLDIFRASALWLHFNREGSVVNPFKELHCYVSDRVTSW